MNIYNWQTQSGYKSICRTLMSKNIISYDDWIIDISYFLTDTPVKIRNGYQIWSKLVIFFMRRSKLFERVISIMAQWLIEDIKYKKGLRKRIHLRGLILRHVVFNPISLLFVLITSLKGRYFICNKLLSSQHKFKRNTL